MNIEWEFLNVQVKELVQYKEVQLISNIKGLFKIHVQFIEDVQDIKRSDYGINTVIILMINKYLSHYCLTF